MEVGECSWCKGVWLDGHKLKQLQEIQNSNIRLIERGLTGSCKTGNINEEKISENDYYYYKVDFTENGTIDELFGFEFT